MINRTKATNIRAFAALFNSPIENQQTFNNNDYKTSSVLETRPKGKIIKLFRCFGCEGCVSSEQMSGLLMICKNCLASELVKDERSRRRFVEKTLNKISVFLGRHV